VTILVGVGAAIFALIGLRQLSWLVAPVFLAMVIVVLVHPLHGWLRLRHVPSAPALLLLLVAIYGLIIGLVVIIAVSLARLATLRPPSPANWVSSSRISRPDLPSSASAPIRLGP
jgi:predicted PurR-regulated permease PerM